MPQKSLSKTYSRAQIASLTSRLAIQLHARLSADTIAHLRKSAAACVHSARKENTLTDMDTLIIGSVDPYPVMGPIHVLIIEKCSSNLNQLRQKRQVHQAQEWGPTNHAASARELQTHSPEQENKIP